MENIPSRAAWKTFIRSTKVVDSQNVDTSTDQICPFSIAQVLVIC
jgi:predicted acetyltransferase